MVGQVTTPASILMDSYLVTHRHNFHASLEMRVENLRSSNFLSGSAVTTRTSENPKIVKPFPSRATQVTCDLKFNPHLSKQGCAYLIKIKCIGYTNFISFCQRASWAPFQEQLKSSWMRVRATEFPWSWLILAFQILPGTNKKLLFMCFALHFYTPLISNPTQDGFSQPWGSFAGVLLYRRISSTCSSFPCDPLKR